MSNEIYQAAKESIGERSLALSETKQSAIMGHVFNPASHIFLYLINVAEKTWWVNPMHAIIWEGIQAFYKTEKKCPTMVEVLNNNNICQRENAEVNRIKGLLSNAEADRKQFSVEPLRRELQAWMHAKILQSAYKKGHHLWNLDKHEQSAEIIKDAIKQINQVSFTDTFELKLTDLKEIAKDLGKGSVVPFGIRGIDEHLFPKNPKGSLRKGDQTVLMAPVNMGKTTALITVAVHNIRAGQDVLFVSHEGHRSDLRLKMIRCYMSLVDEEQLRKVFPNESEAKLRDAKRYLRTVAALPLIDIVDYMLYTITEDEKALDPKEAKRNNGHRLFNQVLDFAQQRITFMPIHRPGMAVEDILVHIERQQGIWKDTHLDAADEFGNPGGNPKGYDLFVCDYPGVLTTNQNSKGQLAWRQSQQIVYDSFVQLALQQEWHSLVAIQTNRDGSKINAGTHKFGEQRFLTNEDVAECWGAIMSASTVFTINRSPNAAASGRVTFLIAKSRSSTTGYAVTCMSNFSLGISHADELGCIGYVGHNEQQAVIDMYLKTGKTRFLTEAETTGAVSGTTINVGAKP